jgi:NADPH:quinone reductase
VRAIRVSRWGGPEVLELVDDAPVPEPGEGQVLMRVNRAGVNYADTHQTENSYLASYELPLTPGAEVAGTTEDGRHVVALTAGGGYAEYAAVPAATTFDVPDGVSDGQALALLVQGLTAWHLYMTSARMREGESVVVHAAAGGVGLLLTQLATGRGARVIATVSTPEKEELARAAGAAEVLRYSDDLAERVRDLTDGVGVAVAYDGVGKSTFDASMDSLRRRGMLVLFGAASGPVPPVDPQRLNAGGSLYLTRPTLFHHIATREELLSTAQSVYAEVAAGRLDVRIGHRYALEEARAAHEDLHARRTTGKLVLIP